VPKWIARSQEADGLDRSADYTTSNGVCQAGTVRLTIHPPIAAGEWDNCDNAALAERVPGIIASKLPV